MLKLFRKKKILRAVAFFLVAIFTINVTSGCTDVDNGVLENQNGGGNSNSKLGIGRNITGNLVYSKSTFDPMSENLFIGYLLNARNFTLVVVPGDKDGNPNSSDNYLFTSAQAGLLQYDDSRGAFINPEYKALTYYTTNEQLLSWFENMKKDDNFLTKASKFTTAKFDLDNGSRFTCDKLVNLGSGLNSSDFCNRILTNSKKITYTSKDGTEYSKLPFADSKTGGMVIFFGAYSVEGYFTYDDIVNYDGSSVANSFDNCYYSVGNVGSFDYPSLAKSYISTLTGDESLGGYGYKESAIKDFIENPNQAKYDVIKQDIVSIHTDVSLQGKVGCDRLKTSYELIERALIADYGKSISALKSEAKNKKNSSNVDESDKYSFIYSTIEMLENFNEYAKQESFNIKFSVGLFDRYNSVTNVSGLKNLVTGRTYDDLQEIDYDTTLKLTKGNDEDKVGDYLLLVTAEGFIFDRGTSDEITTRGAEDMLGFSNVLEQMALMDSCPSQTIAAAMFNALANLKIGIGIAVAVTGAAVVTGAVIGLTIASVIGKLATFTAITPVPGARIAAMVLAAIAGLIAIGVGIATLISGLKDKAYMRGIGASEDNYCKTYKATMKKMLQEIQISIPVYTYNIEREKDNGKNISLNYCSIGDFDNDIGKCVYTDENGKRNEKDSLNIPLYYYANKEEANELNLAGMPIIMYFRDHQLVDFISGATTPEYIVEIVRIWGLLAAREIVYQNKIVTTSNGIKIDTYHTSNTNARTLYINEAKYCITLEYEKNLYNGVANNEFCYFDSSYTNSPKTIRLSLNSYSISKPILSVDFTKEMAEKTIEQIQNSKLSFMTAYRSQVSYKINQFIKDNFNLKDEVKDYTINNVNFENVSSSDELIEINYNDGESAKTMSGHLIKSSQKNTKYYFIEVDSITEKVIKNIYSIDLSVGDDETGEMTYTIKLIAERKKSSLQAATYKTFKDNINDIKNDISEGVKDVNANIEFANVIEFIAGDYKFKVDESIKQEENLYFTTTVKDTPQQKCGNDDEEKYEYDRNNTFLGLGNGRKCLTDDKVRKGNDTPVKSSSTNVYSASIKIGEFIAYVNENGEIVIKATWVQELGGN